MDMRRRDRSAVAGCGSKTYECIKYGIRRRQQHRSVSMMEVGYIGWASRWNHPPVRLTQIPLMHVKWYRAFSAWITHVDWMCASIRISRSQNFANGFRWFLRDSFSNPDRKCELIVSGFGRVLFFWFSNRNVQLAGSVARALSLSHSLSLRLSLSSPFICTHSKRTLFNNHIWIVRPRPVAPGFWWRLRLHF